MKNQSKYIFYTSIAFILTYLLGFLFPDYWWSIHFMHFIPVFFQVIIGILVLFLLVRLYRNKNISSSKNAVGLTIAAVFYITIGYVILMFFFPMIIDYYGDAYKFNKFLEIVPSQIPEGTNDNFFNLKLSPWSGEGTILALITYVAYFFAIYYSDAFYIFDIFFGGLFVFCWLFFIHKLVLNKIWQFVLVLMGCTAPFMLVFFRHIEIYAPIFFIHLLIMTLFIRYIKESKKIFLWLAIILLIISLKLHLIGLVLLPVLVIFLWKKIKGNYPRWKEVFLFLVLPIFISGGCLYFFYFQDHIDTRSLQQHTLAFEHTFLPIVSPSAPLDNYNMFSFNHIIDFFSLVFLWSPIAIFLIVIILLSFRKKINWNAPEIIVSGFSLLVIASFFFAVNPLLGMPIDWDLFSLPATFLLVFVVALVMNIQQFEISNKIKTATVLIVVLTLPVFIVHQFEDSLSRRLESVSVRIYKTYYEWTAQTLEHAYSIGYARKNNLDRGDVFLEKIKPYTQKEIDYEYAEILTGQGRYAMRVAKDPERALKYFNQVQEYSASSNAKLLSLEAYFYLSDYHSAYNMSKELLSLKFPSYAKALKINIHCALEAEKYNEAYLASKTYLQQWPEDKVVKEVFMRLSKNNNIGDLKYLFVNPTRN